jgi:hypothetical protein
VNAKGLGASEQHPLLGSARVISAAVSHPDHRDRSQVKPVGSRTMLSSADRLRAAFLGLGFGALALILATVGGLAIAGGPFHTSLGSLA